MSRHEGIDGWCRMTSFLVAHLEKFVLRSKLRISSHEKLDIVMTYRKFKLIFDKYVE